MRSSASLSYAVIVLSRGPPLNLRAGGSSVMELLIESHVAGGQNGVRIGVPDPINILAIVAY